MNRDVQMFVAKALAAGHSRDAVAQALGTAGWSPEEVATALDAYVAAGLGLPVPRKSASRSPKEAFLFLLLFAALITWTFSLGSMIFDLLNLWMPQPGSQDLVPGQVASLRGQAATVLVAFPVFLFMDHLAAGAARRNPDQRISPIRRWLTYLTLLLAASALISDLIVLANTFLEGELTTRFLLKVLVVGVLAGAALGHYLLQLRKDELDPTSRVASRGRGRAFLAAAVALVLGLAIWNAGSPARVRMHRMDAARVRDLQRIQAAVSRHAAKHGALPTDLEQCDADPGTFLRSVRDPETRDPYRYQVLDASHYELGATFATASSPEDGDPGFWRHSAGAVTFQVEWKALPSGRQD
jgi:hypothetical protein